MYTWKSFLKDKNGLKKSTINQEHTSSASKIKNDISNFQKKKLMNNFIPLIRTVIYEDDVNRIIVMFQTKLLSSSKLERLDSF